MSKQPDFWKTHKTHYFFNSFAISQKTERAMRNPKGQDFHWNVSDVKKYFGKIGAIFEN